MEGVLSHTQIVRYLGWRVWFGPIKNNALSLSISCLLRKTYECVCDCVNPCVCFVDCCFMYAVQIYYETTRHLSAGQELLLPPREPLQLDMFADTNASLEDRSDRESGQSVFIYDKI